MYRGRPFEMVDPLHRRPDRSEARRSQFLKSKEASFTNYMYNGDTTALVAAVDPTWPAAIPYTLVIKPGGEVLYKHLGAIDPLAMKKAIVDYLGRTYK